MGLGVVAGEGCDGVQDTLPLKKLPVPWHIEYFKLKEFETAEGRGKVTDPPACFLNLLQLKIFNMAPMQCKTHIK